MRNRYFFVIDVCLLMIVGVLSFSLRYDFNVSTLEQRDGIFLLWAISIPTYLFVFFTFNIYARYWFSAGPRELLMVGFACLLAGSIVTLITFVIALPADNIILPRTVPFIHTFIMLTCIGGVRFAPRAYQSFIARKTETPISTDSRKKHVLIIGAGNSGLHVLQSLLSSSRQNAQVVGFVDDDPEKVGALVRGVRVLGYSVDLKRIIAERQVDLVIIAVSSAPGKLIRHIVSECQSAEIDYKIMPGVHEITSGKVTINTLRPVSIDDLLRRPPVTMDTARIRSQIEGKCVLITGAGGSIGSELARQIARFNPCFMVLLGHGENSLFSVEHKLKREFPKIQHKIVLADVRDFHHLERVFEEYHPSLVFHAAAHKHVPMLETNAAEAVLNNVIGTRNLIQLSNRFNVDRMVFISTDKAVEPYNTMGMTKRVAEMLIMDASRISPSRFAAVRFGNVLGSRGSVVPLFQEQITAGGPVTITSDEITRYFMSIPEAVSLVLRASVYVGYGPLFVLNMGTPVRIYDLACDLIRLNGLQPGTDVEIKVIGLRPGEKLYEELIWSYETQTPIENGALFAIGVSQELVQEMLNKTNATLEKLIQAAKGYNGDEVRGLLEEIVYFSPETREGLEKNIKANPVIPKPNVSELTPRILNQAPSALR